MRGSCVLPGHVTVNIGLMAFREGARRGAHRHTVAALIRCGTCNLAGVCIYTCGDGKTFYA